MNRTRTGEGYIYYRDRSCGQDSTVYEHQLVMLLEHDPRDVFDPDVDVHHCVPARDINYPDVLELVDRYEHRSQGGDRWVERQVSADGGSN